LCSFFAASSANAAVVEVYALQMHSLVQLISLTLERGEDRPPAGFGPVATNDAAVSRILQEDIAATPDLRPLSPNILFKGGYAVRKPARKKVASQHKIISIQ